MCATADEIYSVAHMHLVLLFCGTAASDARTAAAPIVPDSVRADIPKMAVAIAAATVSPRHTLCERNSGA